MPVLSLASLVREAPAEVSSHTSFVHRPDFWFNRLLSILGMAAYIPSFLSATFSQYSLTLSRKRAQDTGFEKLGPLKPSASSRRRCMTLTALTHVTFETVPVKHTWFPN